MGRYQQNYRALGSEVFITLVSEKDNAVLEQLFDKIHKHITDFEQRFSRFLPKSELTTFNQNAGTEIPTSPALHKLLVAAKSFSVNTEGLYNPFILPALQKAGYIGSWPHPYESQKSTNFTGGELVGIENLEINSLKAKIPKNTAVDFGGIGKGYLLDELSHILIKERLNGYWLSFGGDIICNGYDINDQPWKVAVQSASDTTKNIETISNKNGRILAIATSGVTKRKGLKNGRMWHHIIDPRTGEPATTNVLTATVTADKAVIADVYAKCIVIAGSVGAELYKKTGIVKSCIVQLSDSKNTIKIGEV